MAGRDLALCLLQRTHGNREEAQGIVEGKKSAFVKGEVNNIDGCNQGEAGTEAGKEK